jgi:proteasome lid subunit RPN8/RPN11
MLEMSRAHYDEIIAYCRSTYPKEACGVLAGDSAEALGEHLRVVQVYPMANAEDSPIGYSLDPKEQLAIEKRMRQRGQRMVGIFHSHTASPAYPSSVDVRLAISPDLSYVLVSLQDRRWPELKSYRIDGTRVIPEGVQVLDAPAGARGRGAGG